MVHRDFHTGNILINGNNKYFPYISGMGLCGEVGNIDETKIYGVMPFVAPEVLRGRPYTQAADIYSFALNICNGIMPEITEPQAPKCYIDLMKRCWDLHPSNRPNVTEVLELIGLFYDSYKERKRGQQYYEIKKQIEEAEKYRQENLLTIENDKPTTAIYTSWLLNPFTKNLPKYNNSNNNSIEIIDFTK
ncbi:kinase-like domain-containing protein [Glomus cerebriforme]|uniref:Kinase-like domain-containing protein n=1 Tax=Glomus cerebriforme TaxID=658196 RepID=A0A397TFU1_9GLOM|nr:kinase-like domain-containing protein [Glomus cerebriforme]